MEAGEKKRKWIGVVFSCCRYYGRAYLDEKKREYQARCPRCNRKIRFVVGPSGTDRRFFDVC